MVFFLGWWVPKVGSNIFTFVAISGQDGNRFCEHPGVPVSVTRPSMESIDEELCESDEQMPELLDDEDDEANLPLMFTPRVALGEMFEALAGEMRSPVRCPRQGFGWNE